jgi:hypothetical protein
MRRSLLRAPDGPHVRLTSREVEKRFSSDLVASARPSRSVLSPASTSVFHPATRSTPNSALPKHQPELKSTPRCADTRQPSQQCRACLVLCLATREEFYLGRHFAQQHTNDEHSRFCQALSIRPNSRRMGVPRMEHVVSVASRVPTSNVKLLLTGKSEAATDR